MKSEFKKLQDRHDRLECENRQLKQDNVTLKATVATLQHQVKTQNDATEKLKRHSFSYDLLLHGVPENDAESSESLLTTVTQYLTDKDQARFIPDMEGYVHRLGPKKHQPTPNATITTDDVQLRPRPLLFRMRCRAAQSTLVNTLSKRSIQAGPYLSSHLTPAQMDDLRQRHNKITSQKRPGSPNETAAKGRRAMR